LWLKTLGCWFEQHRKWHILPLGFVRVNYRAIDKALEEVGMDLEELQDTLLQELLIIPPRLVSIDIRQSQLDQDGTDVRVLDLDSPFRPRVELARKRLPVNGLRVLLLGKFLAKHVEVVTDDRLDLATIPIIGHRVGVYPRPLSHRAAPVSDMV